MRSYLTLAAVTTGVMLSAGCVIEPLPPPPEPIYRGGYVEPLPPPQEIYVPSVVIVERGVVHNYEFYRRHPDIYWRDRRCYPERFGHRPPPRDPHHHHNDHDHDGHGNPPPRPYY